MNEVRFPIMLLIMVVLTVAIGATYYMKTRLIEPVEIAAEEVQAPSVEDQWNEWTDDPETMPMPEQMSAPMSDFDKALSLSRQTGQLVMLFFTSDRAETQEWVPKMRKTLSDRKVVEAISQFIFCEINCDREPARYALVGYPTIVIVDGVGNVKKHLCGYKGTLAFRMWLRDIKAEPLQQPQLGQPQLEQPRPERERRFNFGSRFRSQNS